MSPTRTRVKPEGARDSLTAGATLGRVGGPELGAPSLTRRLQEFSGNRATAALLRSMRIQPKLTISDPGDPTEEEADRVAEQVMRMPAPAAAGCSCGGTCDDCQQKSTLRRSALGASASADAPPMVHDVLRSPGLPIDAATRRYMEPRFGADLGDIRVHTDSRAAESAAQVSARAYTVGNHIVFGTGEWQPGGQEGDQLIAHELTHALQRGAGIHRKPIKPPYRAQIVSPPDAGGKPGVIQTCQDVNAKGCRTDVLAAGMEVTVTNEFVGGLWLFVEHLPKEAAEALHGQQWIYVQSKFVKRLPATPASAKATQPAGEASVQQLGDAIYGRDTERTLDILNAGGLENAFALLRKVHAAAAAQGQISPILYLTDDFTLTTGDERSLLVAVAAHTVSLGFGLQSGAVDDAYDEIITASQRLGALSAGIVTVYLDRRGDEAVKSIVGQRRTEQVQGMIEQVERSRKAAKDPLGVFQKRLQEKALRRLDENEVAVRKQRAALAEGGSSEAWQRLQNVVVPEAIHYAQLGDIEEKLTDLVTHTKKAIDSAKRGSDNMAAIHYAEGRGNPPEGAWWRPAKFPFGGGGADYPPNIEEIETELQEDEDQLMTVRDERASIRQRIPLVKALRPALVAKLRRGPGRSDTSAVAEFRREMFAELQKQVFEVASSGIKMLRADVEAGRARLYSFAPLVEEVKAELLLGGEAEERIDTWVKEQTGRDEEIRVLTSALALGLSPLWFVPGAQLIPAIVSAVAAVYNADIVGGQYVAAQAGMAGKDITAETPEDLRWATNLAVLDLVLANVDIGVAVHSVLGARTAARAAEELARGQRVAAAKEAADAAEAAKQAAKPIGRRTKSGLVVFEGGGESTSGPQGKLRAIEGGGQKPVPPKPPPTPEPVEMPKLKTGTDATVEVVGGEVELKNPAGVDPTKGPVASAGKAPGGGGTGKRPSRQSIEGGRSAAERPVSEVHVPPDRPPVRVDPRARGYAIEDLHMDSIEREGFERLPDWFKTHDAFKGGTTRYVTEGGKRIRVVKGADALSIKSTQITEPAALTEKVTEDLNKLRGRFEHTRGGVRLEGVKTRRLDLIFEEGSDITKRTVQTVEQLQRDAGSVQMNWYVIKYGDKIPGPKYLKDYARFIKDL
jgi:hypothetical protein